MRNTEIWPSVCVWCDIYSSSCIDWGEPPTSRHTSPHHRRSPCLSAGWCIWRRKSRRSAVKSASYQRGRVRNSASLSCSQDPAVSHTALLTAQHHHHQSDHLTGEMRRLHQVINTLMGGRPTCPVGTSSLSHCKHQLRENSLPPPRALVFLASLHQCLHPWVFTALIPPADKAVTHQ